jgi:hypothetical protein
MSETNAKASPTKDAENNNTASNQTGILGISFR